MNTLALQLTTSFHYVISEQSGNDVTIGRAKTMIVLASITWPQVGFEVTPHYITPTRLMWKSAAFDAVDIGGSFRRDPIGDDASIIMDDVDPEQLIMVEEMRECAEFIPLFGRQRIERFNLTLAEILAQKIAAAPLPLPGSEARTVFRNADEYQQLHGWLLRHGVIDPAGEWLTEVAGLSETA